MNHRRTARPAIPQNFHKYLRPGALARIRDSRITSARSHRFNSICQIPLRRAFPPSSPPHPPPQQDDAVQAAAADAFPFFVPRIYGPRCPQRKKLMAAKSVLFLPVSPAADSPDPVIDSFGSDFIVAN